MVITTLGIDYACVGKKIISGIHLRIAAFTATFAAVIAVIVQEEHDRDNNKALELS